MQRIKLFKFLGVFAIGGTERQVLNLVRELDLSQFELHLGCLRRWGEFLEEIEQLAVPITEYRIRRLYDYNSIRQRCRLAAYLRRNAMQIMHTYGFYSTVFAAPAAKMAGVPVVIVSIRDMGEMLTPMQKRVQKLACAFADSILVNADAVRRWLISQGYDERKITVIRNGITVDRFNSIAAGHRGNGRIRAELGIPERAPVVAMLSRLNRMKGGEYFVQAAAAVTAKFPEARFLIVGDVGGGEKSYKTHLEKLAAELGIADRVNFTGFRTDVCDLLSEINLSVLPSLSEGLSNVLLESMAAGLPVVGTGVGGTPEIIEDGVSGLVVPPRDASALAAAMCRILESADLARNMGRAGRRRIEEHFEVGRMVRQTEQHYQHMIERLAMDPARKPMEVRA